MAQKGGECPPSCHVKGGNNIFLYVLSFILGLTLGSFFNVVGLRVPMKQSLLYPPSHCPSCQNKLAPIDLIPIVSYLFLKGKCRSCGVKIDPLYPLIELMTACVFTAAALVAGFSIELIVAWSLISLLIIIFVSDVRYMLIPDRVLIVFALIFVLQRLWIAPAIHWWQPLAGACVGFIVPFIVAVVSRGNMGGGDIKLFAVLGILLGWEGVLTAVIFSAFYGAVIGGTGLLSGKIHRGQPIPFGPFIAVGALTSYFFGDSLLNWYFHL